MQATKRHEGQRLGPNGPAGTGLSRTYKLPRYL